MLSWAQLKIFHSPPVLVWTAPAMETVGSAPAGFLETNVVHLGAADPLPAFDIDAHLTYAGEQPLNAVAENVEHHCCRDDWKRLPFEFVMVVFL